MIEVFKILGYFTIGTISITGLIGYIFKTYFENYLQNRSEELKLTTQFLLNQKQIKYTKLHEERGEIIKELYSKLLDYKLSIESYLMILSIGGDERNRKEAQFGWRDKGISFEKFYNLNRIFFSSNFCNLSDNLREEMKSINQQISGYLDQYNIFHLIQSNSKESTEYIRMIMNAQKDISLKVEPLLKELEEEFRELLGVESK